MTAFVEEGYIRGWNLGGHNVDLDHGTALFATRSEVDKWNTNCIQQIETTATTEGVDIIGYNPRSKKNELVKIPAKVQRAGPRLQGVVKLALRTCKTHTMRLMLLSNIDVQNGYANGTRIRLLPQDSWTIPNKQYKRRIIKKYDTLWIKNQAYHYNRRLPDSRDVRYLDEDKHKHMKVMYYIISINITSPYIYIYIR